jgi:hypothetical protein
MATKRMQNGAANDMARIENPPADELAGLRNQVRLIYRAANNEDMREVRLELVALLDDLSTGRCKFSWGCNVEEEQEALRRGIAAYCQENPSMVD